MLKRTVLALSATICLAQGAMAGNYPTQAFDAKYSVTTAGTKSDMRMASDGKGHFLTESIMAGQKYGTIVDYLQKTSTSLIPQGKMAMRTKLPDNGGYVADESTIKQMNGKPLGQKTVNGHPCHGYSYTTGGGKTEAWIGDDCKIVVQSTTQSSAGKTVMDLREIAGKPSEDAFKIPAGYKLMSQ